VVVDGRVITGTHDTLGDRVVASAEVEPEVYAFPRPWPTAALLHAPQGAETYQFNPRKYCSR